MLGPMKRFTLIVAVFAVWLAVACDLRFVAGNGDGRHRDLWWHIVWHYCCRSGHEMGKSVVLIEPSNHMGGLTTGGLGATDIGNKAVIGGLARDFYHRVWQHYQNDAAWNRETRKQYNARNPRIQSERRDDVDVRAACRRRRSIARCWPRLA